MAAAAAAFYLPPPPFLFFLFFFPPLLELRARGGGDGAIPGRARAREEGEGRLRGTRALSVSWWRPGAHALRPGNSTGTTAGWNAGWARMPGYKDAGLRSPGSQGFKTVK